MSLFAALYTLLIGPIQLMLEVIFWAADMIFANPGICIIVLSLAVNILVLPLYIRADALQEESRHQEKKMRPYIKHIKSAFTGDERYMILQTFYRQQGYRPTQALKGAASLFLEIPFFMAAYNFLSTLTILEGTSFGPIDDLSAPDGLLVIGGIAVNVLPILMTAINLISSSIYASGLSVKENVQLYGMAALFLILLYNSPAGLVFYWTLNNLFSLIKNLCYRVKDKRKLKIFGCISVSAVGVVALFIVLFVHRMINVDRQFYTIVLCLLLQVPLLFLLLRKHLPARVRTAPVPRENCRLFWLCGGILALLTGLLIPSSVLKSSPEEFINSLQEITSPLLYLLSASLLAAGVFLVWGGVLYCLSNRRQKEMISCIYWLLSGAALVNYMVFTPKQLSLSSSLKIIGGNSYGTREILLNLLVLFAVCVVLFIVWKKGTAFRKAAGIVVCLALSCMSAANIYTCQKILSNSSFLTESLSKQELLSIPLSRKGKNVVVLMLDRAISSYVPYMMKEKPELQEKFSGFTYYPNTISYGTNTNFGSPGLYGGYEYTPLEMNRRDHELLKDKHNEALRVMPVLFDENDFTVTVSDPSYAGYHEIPDLSIYGDHPNIRAYITEGRYLEDAEQKSQNIEHVRRRNFFCYSLSRIVPLALQKVVYYGGNYCDLNQSRHQNFSNQYQSIGLSEHFKDAYTPLADLDLMTDIRDTEENTFLMMASNLPHSPAMLQLPDYTPAWQVDNRAYLKAHREDYIIDGHELKMDTVDQVTHYQVNMATFLVLSRWFDYLRENDVYDNTRIILVSDHGYALHQIDALNFGERRDQDIMLYNCLLMEKDFNSHDYTQDSQFMTNADVPTLAFDGLLDNPQNPSTGKPISSIPKHQGDQYVFCSEHWNIEENNGTRFMEGIWHSVHDNVLDQRNWSEVEDPSI